MASAPERLPVDREGPRHRPTRGCWHGREWHSKPALGKHPWPSRGRPCREGGGKPPSWGRDRVEKTVCRCGAVHTDWVNAVPALFSRSISADLLVVPRSLRGSCWLAVWIMTRGRRPSQTAGSCRPSNARCRCQAGALSNGDRRPRSGHRHNLNPLARANSFGSGRFKGEVPKVVRGSIFVQITRSLRFSPSKPSIGDREKSGQNFSLN